MEYVSLSDIIICQCVGIPDYLSRMLLVGTLVMAMVLFSFHRYKCYNRCSFTRSDIWSHQHKTNASKSQPVIIGELIFCLTNLEFTIFEECFAILKPNPYIYGINLSHHEALTIYCSSPTMGYSFFGLLCFTNVCERGGFFVFVILGSTSSTSRGRDAFC